MAHSDGSWAQATAAACLLVQLEAHPYCLPEHMNSEDTLFMLFTSGAAGLACLACRGDALCAGSTGKPKGIAHTTGSPAVPPMQKCLQLAICSTQ